MSINFLELKIIYMYCIFRDLFVKEKATQDNKSATQNMCSTLSSAIRDDPLCPLLFPKDGNVLNGRIKSMS